MICTSVESANRFVYLEPHQDLTYAIEHIGFTDGDGGGVVDGVLGIGEGFEVAEVLAQVLDIDDAWDAAL